MTDKPSEWAHAEAQRLWASSIREAGYWRFEETAIIELGKAVIERFTTALDAARRRGTEEAALCIEGGRFLSDDSPIHREARSLARAIRALADKEPT